MENINKKDLEKVIEAFKKCLNVNNEDVKFLCVFNGGMSNRNYLFEVLGKKYVAHISAEGYELFVDRNNEYDCLDKLKNFKYSQKPIYLTDEVRIFDYVDGISMNTIEYGKYRNEIAKSFHKLHDETELLKENYEPFKFLDGLKNSLSQKFDDLFLESYNVLQKNKIFLENRPLCLCHNDLQPSNLVLNENNEVFILDFEFAKNNDYLFDLATYGNLDFNESIELLKVYKKDYSNEEMKALKLWRIFVNCQWYLVALKKYELGFDEILNLDFRGISMFFLSKNREIIDAL